MTFGSLFAGIGGIDLGLERAGMKCIWQVENDPYCLKVLSKHWPEVKKYGDIKKIEWGEVERPGLICGGFPCQPVSVAGKRRGQDDSRWLWPDFFRAIRNLRPRYVLVENVPGLLSVNNGSAMQEVIGDLASLGLDAEWINIRASDFSAPHKRERIFIVAYGKCVGRDEGARKGLQPEKQEAVGQDTEYVCKQGADVAHAKRRDGGRRTVSGESRNEGRRDAEEKPESLQPRHGKAYSGDAEQGRQDVADAEVWNQGSVVFGRGKLPARGVSCESGRNGQWTVEPDVGRVAHGVPARVDRLKCLGNAVVPQVAEWIGQQIMRFDNALSPEA